MRSRAPRKPTAGRRTRSSWCRKVSASISTRESAAAAPALNAEWKKSFAAYKSGNGELAGEIEPHPRQDHAVGLGEGAAGFSRRREGHGLARRVGEGDQRHCPARAVVHRRLGRSRALDQDQHRRHGEPGSRHARRPQHAFRHPRARHGRDLQRHGGVRPARVRLDVPGILRLHAARRSGCRR